MFAVKAKLAGRRCLVTGASSGLGRAIAEALIDAGARVLLTGRSEERLKVVADHTKITDTHPAPVEWIAADLTKETERASIWARVDQCFEGQLDLLINCAGVGAPGHFESHAPWVLREIFEINVFALAEMCRESLPRFRRGQDPILVNIGSINARRALPGRPEYSASKFAMAGFTESLRAEWVQYGIGVLLVNPGYTDTPFGANALVDTAKFSVSRMRRSQTAEQVARATLRAIRSRKHEVSLSPAGRILLLVNRIAPRFVDWGLNRWTLRLHGRSTNAPAGPPSTPHSTSLGPPSTVVSESSHSSSLT